MARSRRKAGKKPAEPVTNPAALLAMMRKKYDKVCEWEPCSKKFKGINTAKFCSNACRQSNKYAKVKAAKAATVIEPEKKTAPTKSRRRSRRRGTRSVAQ